jgi:hypothetical protein
LLDDFAGLPIVCSRCKVKKSDNATHVLFRRQPQIERLWRSGLPVAGAAPAFRLEEPAYLIACYSGGRAPRLPRILAARLGRPHPLSLRDVPLSRVRDCCKGYGQASVLVRFSMKLLNFARRVRAHADPFSTVSFGRGDSAEAQRWRRGEGHVLRSSRQSDRQVEESEPSRVEASCCSASRALQGVGTAWRLATLCHMSCFGGVGDADRAGSRRGADRRRTPPLRGAHRSPGPGWGQTLESTAGPSVTARKRCEPDGWRPTPLSAAAAESSSAVPAAAAGIRQATVT